MLTLWIKITLPDAVPELAGIATMDAHDGGYTHGLDVFFGAKPWLQYIERIRARDPGMGFSMRWQVSLSEVS